MDQHPPALSSPSTCSAKVVCQNISPPTTREQLRRHIADWGYFNRGNGKHRSCINRLEIIYFLPGLQIDNSWDMFWNVRGTYIFRLRVSGVHMLRCLSGQPNERYLVLPPDDPFFYILTGVLQLLL